MGFITKDLRNSEMAMLKRAERQCSFDFNEEDKSIKKDKFKKEKSFEFEGKTLFSEPTKTKLSLYDRRMKR